MRRLSTMCVGLVALLLVAGCGGGGGGSGGGTSLREGVFLDSVVFGLAFQTDSFNGRTDNAGAFPFRNGEDVEFLVGDIRLGMARARTVMTPVDLVAKATDETNNQVTNIARFLLTLDGNSYFADGITIANRLHSRAAGLSLDFAQTPAAFAGDPQVQNALGALGVGPLVSAAVARAHLQTTLFRALAGRYTGTFRETGGPGQGSWVCYVDMFGNLVGCGSAAATVFFFEGSVTSDGAGVFVAVDEGITFTARLGDGGISGGWSGASNGTIQGVLQDPLDPALEDPTMSMLAGAYRSDFTFGSTTGTLDFTVNADGSMTVAVTGDTAFCAVQATALGVATFTGMTASGVRMTGTIDATGITGTLRDEHSTARGTFTPTSP